MSALIIITTTTTTLFEIVFIFSFSWEEITKATSAQDQAPTSAQDQARLPSRGNFCCNGFLLTPVLMSGDNNHIVNRAQPHRQCFTFDCSAVGSEVLTCILVIACPSTTTYYNNILDYNAMLRSHLSSEDPLPPAGSASTSVRSVSSWLVSPRTDLSTSSRLGWAGLG